MDDGGEDGREADADTDTAGRDTTVIGQVALARAAAGMQEAFSAALVPTGESAGQLVLRWRDHRWAADFRFADPPEPDEGQEEETSEPAEESDDANVSVGESEGDESEGEEPDEDEGPRVANDRESLRFDSDTSAGARFLRLSERHESAVELPGDARLAVLFWQEQSVDLEDFAGVETLADGEVLRLTQAAVIRLRNETPLRFGGVTLPTGNLAPGFAGSYGLWLKRRGDGWRLVFNHEAELVGHAARSGLRRGRDRPGLLAGWARHPPARCRSRAGNGRRRPAGHSLGRPRVGRRLHDPGVTRPRPVCRIGELGIRRRRARNSAPQRVVRARGYARPVPAAKRQWTSRKRGCRWLDGSSLPVSEQRWR